MPSNLGLKASSLLHRAIRYVRRRLPKRGFEPRDGVESESCSAEMLKLSRFSNGVTLYRGDEKSEQEQLLNPFGDPWLSREAHNKFIPTMTGSLVGFLNTKVGKLGIPLRGTPEVTHAYTRYSGYSTRNYHYDESVCKLTMNMPAFEEMRETYKRKGLAKRFIGYAVMNYDDTYLFGKNSGLPEDHYVHQPERSPNPEDRLKFVEGEALVAHGYVFDIRKPEVRTALCNRVLEIMVSNEVDAVLIDYAVRRYGFGAPGLIFDLPKDWFPSFQENQFKMFTELHGLLKANGKTLFLNGTMLDSILVTEPQLVRQYLKASDGMFWEQPFRWEWRNYERDGVDYYDRLQEFFDNSHRMKKQLIVKSGTYRFHGTEDVIAGWTTRFKMTDEGIERHLAEYLTCFFMLYANRHYDTLFHTHPTEHFDIYTSEAYFDIWSKPIGPDLTKRVRYSKHVHMREFENAFVFVNNTLDAVELDPSVVEGELSQPIPAITLEPLSGKIVMKDELAAIEGGAATN
ncbi:hypothetical protein KUV46_07665 [Thalassovita mediterranea]|nr:hypothetical protein KUV46_07665 [Thalassovita mediterranea]